MIARGCAAFLWWSPQENGTDGLLIADTLVRHHENPFWFQVALTQQ